MGFTEEQIQNWQIYEHVRKSGWFNMFTSDARRATGLHKDEYLFVMENYDGLKAQHEAQRKDHDL